MMRALTFGSSIAPIEKALVLGAHSDDIEIGAGGTLRWLLQWSPNTYVHWVVFAASDERENEARTSAEALLGGARHRIETFEFRDGFFPYEGGHIKEEFERLKTQCNPDLIFTHHREDLHQDHRLIAELTWNTYRDHFVLEYEVPKFDGGLGSPNFFVPLPHELVNDKVSRLIKHFGTQRSKLWFTEETFKGLMRLRGIECQSPTGYAEAFYSRKGLWAAPDALSAET